MPLLALGILRAPAEALETGKVYRVGYLNPAGAALAPIRLQPLRDGLRELGYVEGRNVAIPWRRSSWPASLGPEGTSPVSAQRLQTLPPNTSSS